MDLALSVALLPFQSIRRSLFSAQSRAVLHRCRRLVPTPALLALAAGCASTNTVSDLALRSYPAKSKVESITCSAPCDTEWERAQNWLEKHARWPVESVTDSSIQTKYPADGHPSYGFSVTRLPDRSEGYLIKFYMGCGNRSGCDLDPSRIRNAFFHYLQTGADTIRNAAFDGVSIK